MDGRECLGVDKDLRNYILSAVVSETTNLIKIGGGKKGEETGGGVVWPLH